MGGTVALMVAGKVPEKVAGLVLVDPVILPPQAYRGMHMLPAFATSMVRKNQLAKRARKRRSEFTSRDEIVES